MLAFGFFLTLLFISAAEACPGCKEAVAEGSDTLSQGFARSIYLMMAAPYILFAGVTFAIVRAARRNRAKR